MVTLNIPCCYSEEVRYPANSSNIYNANWNINNKNNVTMVITLNEAPIDSNGDITPVILSFGYEYTKSIESTIEVGESKIYSFKNFHLLNIITSGETGSASLKIETQYDYIKTINNRCISCDCCKQDDIIYAENVIVMEVNYSAGSTDLIWDGSMSGNNATTVIVKQISGNLTYEDENQNTVDIKPYINISGEIHPQYRVDLVRSNDTIVAHIIEARDIYIGSIATAGSAVVQIKIMIYQTMQL